MWTRDDEIVSQMIEEGLKKRKEAEDRARPVGTLQYRVIRWPEGIWEGSYADIEDAARRAGRFSKATMEIWKWNGEKWEQVW